MGEVKKYMVEILCSRIGFFTIIKRDILLIARLSGLMMPVFSEDFVLVEPFYRDSLGGVCIFLIFIWQFPSF